MPTRSRTFVILEKEFPLYMAHMGNAHLKSDGITYRFDGDICADIFDCVNNGELPILFWSNDESQEGFIHFYDGKDWYHKEYSDWCLCFPDEEFTTEQEENLFSAIVNKLPLTPLIRAKMDCWSKA